MPLPGEKPRSLALDQGSESKNNFEEVLQRRPKPTESCQTSSRSSKQSKRTRGKGRVKGGVSFQQLALAYSELYQSGLGLEFLSTGSINADKMLGGGLPRGRISEWMSPAGMGKSTLALWACKTTCEVGGRALYIDDEYAVNDSLISGVGLDKYDGSQFFIAKLQTFSEAEEVIDAFFSSAEPPDLVVVDSITALSSTKLQDGGMKIEDAEPGWQARLLSNFFLKYKGKFGQMGTHLMCINQMRVKLSFRGTSSMDGGGGNPMKYYPDIRVRMTNGGDIVVGGNKIGSDVGIETIKNKVTVPFQKNVISILFGKGISNIRACTFLLEAEGVVSQSGSYFTIEIGGSKQTVQGRTGLTEFITKNESLVMDFLRSRGRL